MEIDEFKASAARRVKECLTDEDGPDIENALEWLERLEMCQKNEGYATDRLNYDKGDLENAFHDEWIKENLPQPGLNSGRGILQGLMNHHEIEISDRERKIVASIIQWLGTNIGSSFLDNSLKRAGYSPLTKTKQR